VNGDTRPKQSKNNREECKDPGFTRLNRSLHRFGIRLTLKLSTDYKTSTLLVGRVCRA
jgi:hypothetical protein